MSIFLLLLISLLSVNADKCSDTRIKLDNALNLALYTTTDHPLPKTEETLKDFCSLPRKISKLLNLYSKCMDTFPKHVVTVFVNNIKKTLRKSCKITKEETLNNLRCMDKSTLQQYSEISSMFIRRIRYARDNVSIDNVLPAICCPLWISLKDISELPPMKCSDKSVNTSKFAKEYFLSSVTDVTELICGGYSTINECNQKKPKLMKKLNNIKSTDINDNSLIDTLIPALTRLA